MGDVGDVWRLEDLGGYCRTAIEALTYCIRREGDGSGRRSKNMMRTSLASEGRSKMDTRFFGQSLGSSDGTNVELVLKRCPELSPLNSGRFFLPTSVTVLSSKTHAHL
ncbi:hypothetical protein PM082_018548 [Marasmius tenuissimus]|nr:hypothetical protein PM082_018548 [Marasmius tenuissimus]